MIISGFLSNIKGVRPKFVRAFALVSVLAILALLMVLVLSISAVIHVETRSSASSKNQLIARQNALLGLDTAIGQLQEYAGKDQAVTFPATTFYPTKDINLSTASSPRQGKGDLFDNATYGYRTKAVTSKSRSYLAKVGTYLTPTERTAWDNALKTYWNANRNPHWTGIMDTSLRVDRATNPNADPVALPAQSYESNPSTKFGEPKRDQLPVWLVSGNEKFEIDQSTDTSYPTGYQTPDTALPDPDADSSVVYLVGAGSAADNSTSSDGLDGRVKAKKQAVVAKDMTGADKTTGYYAYWVGDESTKANFAVRDRTSTNDSSYPNDVSKTSETYRNRLQSPQHIGWQNLTGFNNATFGENDPNLENINTSQEIGLVEPNDSKVADIKTAAKNNFHSLTAFSKSLLTDTALGGLKKDLTVFLQTGSGLVAGNPIADTSLYNTGDARFKAWGGANGGFPNTTANLPTWNQLRTWYANEATSGGSIAPNANTAPVLTYIMFHGGWSYDGASQKIRWHWLPCIVLWNPYDVGLSTATYDLEVGIAPGLYKTFVVNEHPSLAELQKDTGADWQGTEGQPSTYTFLDSDGITRKHLLTGNPDSIDMTNGPWPYDSKLNDPQLKDGTTDAFGRFWYYLTSSNSTTYSSHLSTFKTPPANGSALGMKQFSLTFYPHSSSAPAHSNDPLTVTRPLRFQITASFAAGETKVFTLARTQKWNPSDAVALDNNFDPDAPASLWFDALDVANGPASSGGNLKFNFSQVSNTVAAPSIHFSIGGQTIMESSRFGGVRGNNLDSSIQLDYQKYVGYGTGNQGDADNDTDGTSNRNEVEPKFVSTWRPLYDFSTFDANMQVTKTNDSRSSIWPYGVTWLQPLISNGGGDKSQLHNYLPIFSRFNIAAKSFDLHPLVDVKRSFDIVHNTDAMCFYSYTRFKDAWSTSDPSKWDDDQANGTAGYALVTPKNTETVTIQSDTTTFNGLSVLPIRNAMRTRSEILSIGQFQQANISPFFWEPAFPIGNSFAAPYTDREAIAGINTRAVGVATDSGFAIVPFTGALTAAKVPDDNLNRMLDLSYLLNENLWDRYFLSTIPQTGAFSTTDPLPNSRMRFRPDRQPSPTEARNINTASAYLENIGALNVNSTSVEAWKALLTAFRGLSLGATPDTPNVPVSRTLDPVQGSIQFTNATQNAVDIGATATNKDYSKILGGFRYLTDAMIQTLAERIVDEIRLRGPFLSLADFVNRRLNAPAGSGIVGSDWYEARTNGAVGSSSDDHPDWMNPSYDPFIGLQGLAGTLERAIQVSGINGGVNYPAAAPNATDRVYGLRIKNAGSNDGNGSDSGSFTATGGAIANNASPHHSQDPAMRSHLDSEHVAAAPVGEAGQIFDGAPGFVTQGDLLAMIGSALTPRGDTFLVRTYGDAVDKNGKVLARSYLEAIVQRMAEPVTPAGTAGTDQWRPTDKFGRKFKIVKLRWLNPEEI